MDPDQIDEEGALEEWESVDELRDEMEKIKVLCVAAQIIELTRLRPNDEKRALSEYCDVIMLRPDEDDPQLADEARQRHR